MIKKKIRKNIINGYLNCINSKLDILFDNNIIDKNKCLNKIDEYLNAKISFIPKDVIFVSYKVNLITTKDIKKLISNKESSINYENIIESKVEDLSKKYSLIYTNAENSNLEDFDFDKIYFMYDEKIVPDASYSYLLKECTMYVYLNDEYLKLINPASLNLQIA